MAEGDRLRHLQMREPRHYCGGVLRGDIDQTQLQRAQQGDDTVNFATQEQADISRHLVIA